MEIQKIALKYGSITGVVLIVYFLLLSTIDLHLQPVFSFANLLISGIGIFLAILELKKLNKESFRYQFGFAVGLITGFTTTIIFTLFSILYTTEINPDFSQTFMSEWELDWFANNGMLVLTIFLIGLATTVVFTLSIMQLFKDSWNTKEGSRHTLSGNNNVKGKE